MTDISLPPLCSSGFSPRPSAWQRPICSRRSARHLRRPRACSTWAWTASCWWAPMPPSSSSCTTGNLWLGLLAAIVVGLLMGLLMSFISVTLKAEQGISGIGLYMFGLGLSSLLFKVTVGTVKTVVGFQPVKIPLLGDIPLHRADLLPAKPAGVRRVSAGAAGLWVLDKTTLGPQDPGRRAEPGRGRFAGRERESGALLQRLPGRGAGRASPARRSRSRWSISSRKT